MKSIVIFSAFALCFEFVASLPYSIDSQRNAGYQARPSQIALQANPPRPYQYSNQQYSEGAYRTPNLQNQPQQLPTVNRDHSFSRNQQRYLPKDPPQQIANQQNIPNRYIQNREVLLPAQIVSQPLIPVARPVQQEKAPMPPSTQITNTVPFIPAVPLVPREHSQLPSDALRRVNDHYQQLVPPVGKEIEIPVILPRPPRVENENIPEVDFDRFFARAANPVEQIPQPKSPHRTPVEQFFLNPKVRDALASTKHKKRYLVIHQDGTVEHVDKIESVAAKHPNYHLVNAGDTVPNSYRERPSVTTTITQLPRPPILQIHEVNQPNVAPNRLYIEPIEKTAAVEIIAPKEGQIEEHRETPRTVKEEEIVQESLTVPSSATAEVEAGLTESDPLTAPQILTSDIKSVQEISPTHVKSLVKDKTEKKPVAASAIAESSYSTIVNELLSKIISPMHLLFNDETSLSQVSSSDALLNKVISAVPLPGVADSSLSEVPSSDIVEANAPDLSNTKPEEQATSGNPEPLTYVEALKTIQDEPHSLTSNNAVAISNVNNDEIAIAHSDSPAQDSSDVVVEAIASAVPNTDFKEPDDNTKHLLHVKVDKLQENVDVPAAVDIAEVNTNENVIVKPDHEPKIVITPAETTLETNDAFVTMFNKYMAEDALFINVPTPDNVNDFDTSKATANPTWFHTSDPDFWKKLSGNDEGFQSVYFFQVHNQPKEEKNVITTIHANGTVVEDTIEKYWAFEGDEPTITKSTKVIHPEDL